MPLLLLLVLDDLREEAEDLVPAVAEFIMVELAEETPDDDDDEDEAAAAATTAAAALMLLLAASLSFGLWIG